jgi:uncharacterized damage-inducible protein DinB
VTPDVAYFRRLLEYDGWANAAALDSLQSGPAPDKARRWLAHVIGAGRLWLSRLRQEPSPMPVWPDLDLATCGEEIVRLTADWMQWLEGLDSDGLTDGVAYRNSKGEFWTSTVGDILTHVALHGGYHRGQIAAAMREAGGTPAYTDFIHAVRTGLVE